MNDLFWPKRIMGMFMVAVVLTAVMGGCKTAPDPIITSGAVLEELGSTFADATVLWKQAHDTKVVSDQQYETWKEFGARFKQLYPVAMRLWDTARLLNDQPAMEQLKALIGQLASEMAVFLVQINTPPKE